jgi:predicted transcriptional regulator
MKTKILKTIIQHGPITARDIKTRCDIECDDTHRSIRLIIEELTTDGWPIASNNKGFFIARNLKERRLYKQRLSKQIGGLKERLVEFESAWETFKSNEDYYLKLIRPQRKIKRRS